MIQLVKVELLPLDAELFRQFRKYQDKFNALHREGVLDIKSGNATLHFDAQGALRRVHIERTVSDTTI